MPKDKKLIEFEERHPFPDQDGVTRLFKFTRFNDTHPEYLEELLVDLRLYHSLPKDFNDPFECKPHWKWPEKPHEVQAIRKRLVTVARNRGESRKNAEIFASNAMQSRDTLEETIRASAVKNYGKLRICSFSTTNTNILRWSHYADSHKGICIEFDATKSPIDMSKKVRYQEEYPELEYPLPHDARGFKPVLTKSSSWEYEQEFRSILVAEAEMQPPHDDTSFFLPAESIVNIYLGAAISERHKKQILDMVARSKISAKVWISKLSDIAYRYRLRNWDSMHRKKM